MFDLVFSIIIAPTLFVIGLYYEKVNKYYASVYYLVAILASLIAMIHMIYVN